MALSLRETFYEIVESDYIAERKRVEFVRIANEFLKRTDELKLPMQLFESIFDIDFHRGVPHPILYIAKKLKKEGLRVTKVRNDYLIRIQKYKKNNKKNKEKKDKE